MRLLPSFVIALGSPPRLAAAPAVGQRPDDQIAPQSVDAAEAGRRRISRQGKFVEADDALETALAVDPRNRAAFTAMARVAQQARSCSARRSASRTRRWRSSRTTATRLPIQGEAMVELGAVARAKENLAKLQKLCPSGCAQLAELSSGDRARARRWPRPRPPEVPKTQLDVSRLESSRASATNSATLTVSARRCAVDSEHLRARRSAPGTSFRLDRSILRRWPKAAAVSRSRTAGSTPAGCSLGTMWTTADITLGGGTKAERWTFIAIRGVAIATARATDRRP